MAFVKQTLSPFSTRAADPLFDFEEPYIQTGVISGQIYTANQVSYGMPKPSYLQIAENSNTVTVVASADEPLRIVFPLGIHDANTGGEVGAWRTFTGKKSANASVTVTVSGSAWIYAEINENGQSNDPNAWTIDFAQETSVGKTYTTSTTQPGSPVDGDVWYDVTNNKLFKYNTATVQWEYKKRVYLGEAGIGTSNYVYTIQSWYPNLEYAKYKDTFYVHYENPWRHYDGVSFTTNGQYTAMEAASWANNATIGLAVSGAARALEAVANSASAMASIVAATNTISAFANSNLAFQKMEANTSAVDYIANSTLAMSNFIGSANAMSYIANSSVYMNKIANSTVSMTLIANSLLSQSAIVSGNQLSTFRNTLANNATILAVLRNSTVANILFDLISTNSSYTTIAANASGQLLSLANTTTGPIIAIGGNTVTEISDGGICYRLHRFNGTSTFSICSIGAPTAVCNTVDVFMIGGGGAGQTPNDYGAGGAGGALRDTAFKVNIGSCNVVIGAGGASPTNSGSNTCFAGLLAMGGGSSGSGGIRDGGSGGGGYLGNIAGYGRQPVIPQPACASPALALYGCGLPAISGEPKGHTGGSGTAEGGCVANSSFHPAIATNGRGGNGVPISITGTAVRYGGGGGYGELGGGTPTNADIGGLGGLGGGGIGISGCNGGINPSSTTRALNPAMPSACFDSERNFPFSGMPAANLTPCLGNGLANRGGGGGGSGHTGIPPWPSTGAGAGGSGVTLIRYRIKP